MEASTLVCHQRPDRSFHWRGRPLPLCARCTGFYLALPIGLAAALLLQVYAGASYLAWLVVTLVAVAPMALDGLTQLLGFRTSTNLLRLATGVLAGAVIGIDIIVILG